MEKTFKEQIEDFKNELKEFFGVPAKFLDFKLADGTIVRCDTESLQKGSKMSVIDEKGAELPLPDGEYANPETGQSFTVEGGFIKDMAAAAPAADAPATDAPAQEGAPDMAKMMEAIAALEARIAALEGGKPAEEMQAEVAKVNETVGATIVKMEAVQKENTSIKEAFGKLVELVEKIANETPAPTKKGEFRRESREVSKTDVEEFRSKFAKEIGF